MKSAPATKPAMKPAMKPVTKTASDSTGKPIAKQAVKQVVKQVVKQTPKPVAVSPNTMITDMLNAIKLKIQEINNHAEAGGSQAECDNCQNYNYGDSTCVCDYRELMLALEKAQDKKLF